MRIAAWIEPFAPTHTRDFTNAAEKRKATSNSKNNSSRFENYITPMGFFLSETTLRA